MLLLLFINFFGQFIYYKMQNKRGHGLKLKVQPKHYSKKMIYLQRPYIFIARTSLAFKLLSLISLLFGHNKSPNFIFLYKIDLAHIFDIWLINPSLVGCVFSLHADYYMLFVATTIAFWKNGLLYAISEKYYNLVVLKTYYKLNSRLFTGRTWGYLRRTLMEVVLLIHGCVSSVGVSIEQIG